LRVDHRIERRTIHFMKKKAPKKTVRASRSKADNSKEVVVAVSGGFDPIHVGHVRMFEQARKHGTKLIVILNNDNWLRKKKHHIFMPDYERKEVIESMGVVDEVVLTTHGPHTEDMSVCETLRVVRPHVFANGGDRHAHNIPETAVCEEIGAKMIFNVGEGGKVQSSSWLLADYVKKVSGQGADKE